MLCQAGVAIVYFQRLKCGQSDKLGYKLDFSRGTVWDFLVVPSIALSYIEKPYMRSVQAACAIATLIHENAPCESVSY